MSSHRAPGGDTLSEPSSVYLVIADTVLVLHAAFVLFVVGSLVAIYAGRYLRWRWIRNRLFRLLHLAAVVVVVVQSWLGMICPLTIFEMALRQRAGGTTYSGAFIAHWVEQLLYYDAPAWVFAVCYSLFGAAVVASWFLVPPRRARG